MWGILISLALTIVSYLLTPKPKQSKPSFAADQEDPTAEAGRTRPVIFGEIMLKSPNVLWYGDKSMHEYDMPVGGGGKKK